MNRVILKGFLKDDPQTSTSPSGKPFARLTVRVPDKWDSKNQEKTAWIKVIAFDKVAEILHKYFVKGQEILVEGRIKTGQYTNQAGQKVFTTDVIAEAIEFCGSPPSKESQPNDDILF